MLTKFLTAAVGLIIALMLLRFFAKRAHRAQIKAQADARNAARPDAKPDPRPNLVTTLEIDPDTGVYRPKS